MEQLGLGPALLRLAGRFSGDAQGQAAPRVTVRTAPAQLPRLPAAVELGAYRIASEALANAARHAHARVCTIRLELDRTLGVLDVEVRDDGEGLPPHPFHGVGLASMRARAADLGGECVIESCAMGGTRVWARLPVEEA